MTSNTVNVTKIQAKSCIKTAFTNLKYNILKASRSSASKDPITSLKRKVSKLYEAVFCKCTSLESLLQYYSIWALKSVGVLNASVVFSFWKCWQLFLHQKQGWSPVISAHYPVTFCPCSLHPSVMFFHYVYVQVYYVTID